MVDYSERLKSAMEQARGPQGELRPVSISELSRAIGVSYQAVRKVLQGGQFGTENNAKAAARLGVSSDWLATGKGQRATEITTNAQATPAEKYAPLLRDLEDIPPAKRKRLLEMLQQAAEEAREAAAHFAARQAVVSETVHKGDPAIALTDAERARVAQMLNEAGVSAPASSKKRSG